MSQSLLHWPSNRCPLEPIKLLFLVANSYTYQTTKMQNVAVTIAFLQWVQKSFTVFVYAVNLLVLYFDLSSQSVKPTPVPTGINHTSVSIFQILRLQNKSLLSVFKNNIYGLTLYHVITASNVCPVIRRGYHNLNVM